MTTVNDQNKAGSVIERLEKVRDSLEYTALPAGAYDNLCDIIEELKAAQPVAHQFQDREGQWNNFVDDRHYQKTVECGEWPIRELFTHP